MAFTIGKIVVNVIIIHKFLAKLHITCLTYRLELAISGTDVVIVLHPEVSDGGEHETAKGETRG